MFKFELNEDNFFTGEVSSGDYRTFDKYIELEEFPTMDVYGRLKAYKAISDTEIVFDEDRYQEVLEANKKKQEKENIKVEIKELKAQLAESDYKIIKTYEDVLVGIPIQYDIDVLHAERQAIRDKINELEKEL